MPKATSLPQYSHFAILKAPPCITGINNQITTRDIITATFANCKCFCKKYFPGFERAYISNIAKSLGVRVSNRVQGKYIYKYEDLINGKIFDNPVLISNYPVDIHANEQDKSKLEKVYQDYQLPIESLIVDGIDNLFVIGRCISAEFEAQAALRIIPSCFSMGEGLAKHLANK